MDNDTKAVMEECTRASDEERITFGEVVGKLMAAGSVGCIVSIAGQRAVYYGRSGETHVEPFPSTTSP